MRSQIATALLLLGLAVVIGAQLALAVGLVRRAPRWRGLLAFVLPPLAPYWGWSAGTSAMRRLVYAWLVALAVYVLGLVLAV